MREVFAPVEPLQAFSDLLTKPCVMVDILPDIPFRIAAVLSGDTVHLRFRY
jgi:hypothetical protein